MQTKQGIFLWMLLILCIFPLWGAQADGTYGTRTYASYDSITLSSSSTVAQAVDWLESFIDEEVGGAMEISTDLMELVELNDQNAYALALLDPADRPTESDIANAYSAFEDASDFNSEIRYYYDRLIYLFNQNAVDREQIMSGELTPKEVDRLKLEMQINDEETASHMTVVVNMQASWINQMANIHNAIDGLSGTNAYIARIRNQAELVLSDQAAAIAAAEVRAKEDPVVDVISDKEIAITVTNEDGKTKLGNISVTLNIKGKRGVTKPTNSNGTAVFWVADFKPNDAGIVQVEVSVDGSANGYQRRELGVMALSGGNVFHMPLRKDDGPYLVKATFDDADMLTVANGMYLTPQNDIDHTIELKVETKGKAINVLAWYRGNGGSYTSWETLLSENFAAGDSKARTVTRKWLQKGRSGAFPEQTPIYFTVSEGSGTAFVPETDESYERDKAVFLGAKSRLNAPASGSVPYTDPLRILDGFKFTLPQDWPVIGGAQVKIPLSSGFDYVMEIGKSFQLGYNYRVDQNTKVPWKSESIKQQEQRLKRQTDKNANVLKSTANGVKYDYMAHRNERLIGLAKATVTPFIYVALDYNFKTNHAVGNIRVGVILGFHFEMTRQFMVGPVPAFIGLELNVSLTVGVVVGLQADILDTGKPTNIAFSGKTGMMIGVHLDIALTVGAGLPRLAYIGLRGCGWINVNITLSANGPDPVWQLGLRAQAVVKFLFFSNEWTFWEYIYPKSSSPAIPLLAPEMEGSLASQTISLEEAQVIIDNLGAPNATAAESDLIKKLPITGGDVRYVSVDERLSYAFWIGRSLKNSNRTRLLYYSFNPTSSASGTMGEVEFGTMQDSYLYTYEFDVDVLNGYVYLVITSGNTPQAQLPDDSEKSLKQMINAQENSHLIAGVWQPSATNLFIVPGTLLMNSGKMRYIPRIRALATTTAGQYFYTYGAVNINLYITNPKGIITGFTQIPITYSHLCSNTAFVTSHFDTTVYNMPDYQLLNKTFSN